MNDYLEGLKHLRESEDHVEFKAARHNYPFAGGSHSNPRERRRCVLGYVVALANECGGRLVLGMEDAKPHNVCGSDFAQDETGNLEAAIYKALAIRVQTREEYEDERRVLKVKYSEKQKNPAFKTMPTEQVLKDLELLINGKLNYAALMLLGKAEVIHRLLPQYEIIVEYRKNKASIQYNARKQFVLPLFLGVYKVWDYLNQPLSNPEDHLRIGPDMHDIQAFNEDSIREGILNALAHRSLQIISSVVIKQSPDELTIINPGGFPLGVDADNILTVSSNPRQKRVAEVLEKTGLVERSGQGVDKMFANSIRDGKLLPSYDGTDDYQVCLTFFAKMKYPKLAQLVRIEQTRRTDDNALNIFQLMDLYRVERGEATKISDEKLSVLLEQGLVKNWHKKWIVNYDSVANVANEPTERQDFILNTMVADEQYTTQSLSRITGIGVRTLQRELLALELIGRVKRVDKGKNVKWVVLK